MRVVSILEVIKSVAKHAALPEAWKAAPIKSATIGNLADILPAHGILGDTPTLNFAHKYKVNSLNHLINSLYQEWRATEAPYYYLIEAVEHAPKWRGWYRADWPILLDSEEKKQALEALIQRANESKNIAERFINGQFENRAQIQRQQPSTNPLSLLDIGFEHLELVEFLNKCKLPHTLGEDSSAGVTFEFRSIEEFPLDKPMRDDERPANDGPHEIAKEQHSNDSAIGRRPHKTGRSAHLLADDIACARRQAGEGRDDWNVVWNILVGMAENPHPACRLRAFVPKKGLEYVSGENIKYFTKDALRKQLDPKARGQKRTP